MTPGDDHRRKRAQSKLTIGAGGTPASHSAASNLGKVAVLMGGRSAEREISLLSGENVLASLKRNGVDAHAFDPARRPVLELKSAGFERAFLALHGRYGEDGTVQGALELLEIPYTGSGVMAAALCMDKVRTKLLWMATGIPTPRHEVLYPNSDWTQVAAKLGLPLMIKPTHEGSSLGLTKVETMAEIAAGYERARRYDASVLAEEFIPGRELTAGFLDDSVLPLVWIEAPLGNYDYHHKYFSEETHYHCPSTLPQQQERQLQALVTRAVAVLGCSGWGRVDLILRDDGRAFLLEANTTPGMTAHSLVPMAARAAGISFDELVKRILDLARLNINQGQLATTP